MVSWLSESWRSFLYSSSVYACHLFLISSVSVRSITFLSFIEPIVAQMVKLLSTMQETWVPSLGQEVLWRRKGNPLQYSCLENPMVQGGWCPWGLKRVRHNWATSLSLCMKCSLNIYNFLEEISSVSYSVVFLYFFSLITEEGFLISPYFSLELSIQMGISFLFFFVFGFSSFHSYL